MSRKKYIHNVGLHFTIYTSWTDNGKKIRDTFKYSGTLTDAIHFCKATVIGAKYPDFNIDTIDYIEW